jgi:hypothetical protein
VEYVQDGGRVLVIDSPENKDSKANALLAPFGLSLEPAATDKGPLAVPEGWPDGIRADPSLTVAGGEPLVKQNGKSVCATAKCGKGTVAAVGFGSRFADLNMGVIGDAVPDANLRKVFELEFLLLKHLVGDKPAGRPATRPQTSSANQ